VGYEIYLHTEPARPVQVLEYAIFCFTNLHRKCPYWDGSMSFLRETVQRIDVVTHCHVVNDLTEHHHYQHHHYHHYYHHHHHFNLHHYHHIISIISLSSYYYHHHHYHHHHYHHYHHHNHHYHHHYYHHHYHRKCAELDVLSYLWIVWRPIRLLCS
jgi:hypothetical protein